MRSVRKSPIFILFFCLLALSVFALVGCGGGDEPNVTTATIVDVTTDNMLTVSTPSIPDLPLVQVPDVVGMSLEDGGDAVRALGLGTAGVHYWILGYDPAEPATIIEQDPEAGTWVPLYGIVELTFNSPGGYVPDVVGMTQSDAGMLLGSGDVSWSQEHVYAATPLSDYWGVVMAQAPAPGTLWGMGPPITIVVGQELATVTSVTIPPALPKPTTATTAPRLTVPNVVGLTEEKAVGLLHKNGLSSQVTYVTTLLPANMGKVIEQNPVAGAQVEPGSVVQLKVGVTPPPVSMDLGQ